MLAALVILVQLCQNWLNVYAKHWWDLYDTPSSPAPLWKALQQKDCFPALPFLQAHSHTCHVCHPWHLQKSIKTCLVCKVYLTPTLPSQWGEEVSWKFTPLLYNTSTLGEPEQGSGSRTEWPGCFNTFPRFQFLPAVVSDSAHSKSVGHLKDISAALVLCFPQFPLPALRG